MDEYLFIQLAKLKADRFKLEQEHREQLVLPPVEELRWRADEREARTRDEYLSRWNWREQS